MKITCSLALSTPAFYTRFGTMALMVMRLEAKGGKGGNEWDDGYGYDDVTKIHVRGGLEGIQFIKFEYVKAGQTTVGPIHGVSAGRGLTQTFEISPSDKEYLVSVDGYYDESTGVIQSIQFSTNKKTSDLMGFNNGTKFSLRSTKGKIIGLHGFADKNLNSLGAYVIRISIKSELIGTQGTSYDDGVYNYDGIRKVYVGTDGRCIRYFKIDYDKAGQVRTHERRDKISEPLHEFEIDYPNEYITYLEGTYIFHPTYKCHVISSIFFKTSKGRHSPIVGLISGTRFVIESPGNVIYGFYGRVGACVDGIGAYFTPPPRPMTNTIKVDAKGGKGGNEWDDGYDCEGVTKIHVRGGLDGIQFLKFEYVKGGKTVVGPFHGSVSGLGLTQTFEINPSDKEYLVSVDGYYDESTGVIQSIQFITNKKTSEIMGYKSGTKFSLRLTGSMIVGFHGFADKSINSLGAHFIKVSIKSELVGGPTTGLNYDDGGYNYDGIRKLYVGSDGKQIRYFKIDYDKAGKMESHERGDKMAQTTEFVVDYPKEYVTSVEGTYAVSEVYKCLVITSVSFKTSKGRSSPVVGRVIGTKFVLESQGHSIVGFYGRVGSCIDSIGAYYGPPPSLHTPPEKLEGQGGDGGSPWDDGAFQNVKKVLVGQGENGIAAVKFVYGNDTGEEVEGGEHGKKSFLGFEEFKLNYPSEYITSVEGCYDKIMGAETGIITRLQFKTNTRTSDPFGLETANKFVLGKEGHKITGFHGKASTTLHQIGVHVVPITE